MSLAVMSPAVVFVLAPAAAEQPGAGAWRSQLGGGEQLGYQLPQPQQQLMPQPQQAQPQQPKTARTAVSEYLSGELARHGLADEHLRAALAEEAAALSSLTSSSASGPKPAASSAASALSRRPATRPRWLAQRLCESLSPSSSASGWGAKERWYHVCQLLDLSASFLSSSSGGGKASSEMLPAEQILTTIAAAWVISTRFCSEGGPGSVTHEVLARLAECATGLSTPLGGGEVRAVDVVQEELRLALTLSCKVTTPTAHVWLRAFTARFDFATRGVLSSSLSVASSLQEQLMDVLVWHSHVSPARPPHATAVGLFALSAARADLRLAEQLRPSEVDSKLWSLTIEAVLAGALKNVWRRGSRALRAIPSAAATASAAGDQPSGGLEKVVSAALEFATMREMDTIKTIARRTLEILRATFAPQVPKLPGGA